MIQKSRVCRCRAAVLVRDPLMTVAAAAGLDILPLKTSCTGRSTARSMPAAHASCLHCRPMIITRQPRTLPELRHPRWINNQALGSV